MLPMGMLTGLDSEDDRSFMERLYTAHRYLMFSIAYRIVKDHAGAEDAVSEACTSLIANMKTLRALEASKLRAYVAATAKNAALDHVRGRDRQNRHGFLTGDEAAFDMPDAGEIDDALIRHAEVEAIREALRKLRPRERDLLRMKYYEALPDAAIAEKLDIGTNSVRHYLTRARRSLLAILTEDESRE